MESTTREAVEHLPLSSDQTKVLVVDDDTQMRQVLCWALEDEGLAAIAAADGLAALELLRTQRPAIVLLDIDLPAASGAEVAHDVQGRFGHAVPIVVISGEDQALLKAKEIGAVACFEKPFDLYSLIDMLQRHLAS